MKIHVDRFFSDDKQKKMDEIIKNIRIGEHKGVVNIHIETFDKYVMINAGGSLSTPDYRGEVISIKPCIYDKYGNHLFETDYENYYKHPDYYSLDLCVELDGYYTSVVIPLKYAYFVSFVPDDMCMNYDCLGEADITVWED
jgi:hypothetical protein